MLVPRTSQTILVTTIQNTKYLWTWNMECNAGVLEAIKRWGGGASGGGGQMGGQVGGGNWG